MMATWWEVEKHPKLKRDFVGRTVRTKRELQNGFMTIPVGTICRVDRRPNVGASLTSDPCPHCGMKVNVGRVQDWDFEFVRQRTD